MKIFDEEEFWRRPAFRRYRATDEEIRENQRLNRLQREKEERAARNDNSTSSNGQDTQDKDRG